MTTLDTLAAFAREHRTAVVLTFDPNAGNMDGTRGAWRCVVSRKDGNTVGGAPAGTPARTWLEPSAIVWGGTPDEALTGALAEALARDFGPSYMPAPPTGRAA